jgi:hypothetical protein
MACILSQLISASYASNAVTLQGEGAFTNSPIRTQALGKEHFFKIANTWKMDINYVEGAYATLRDKKFVRVDALIALREKSEGNNPRENFMRYKLLDRLMSDHMNAFGQRVIRTHEIPGAGFIKIHEFVGLTTRELKALSPDTADEQGFFSLCDEALRDADFDYRRALDIAMKRGRHSPTFEDYRQLATQADVCINLLFSTYAQKVSKVI